MKVMVAVKATAESEAGVMPGEHLLTEMGRYNEELARSGIMRDGAGLHPSKHGVRVRITRDGARSVIDGPFAETKELIAGYWVWEVESMDEAVEWAKRMPNPADGTDGEVEIRPFFEPEDFGEALTPELREQEERIAAAVDARREGAEASREPISRQIFVNLPVEDLDRSIEFFSQLGFTFNPEFTDENATCMIISDSIYVMLLVESYFQTFTDKEVADAARSTEAILALSVGSRAAVDELVGKALAAGATAPRDPQDHGFMYQHGFQDPDGHLWEVFYMDPAGPPSEN